MGTRKIEHLTSGPEGHITWMANTLPTTQSLQALSHLAGLFAKPLGAVGQVKAESMNILDIELSAPTIAGVLGALAESFDHPRTVDLVTTLCTGLRKNGAQINFEDEFSGRTDLLFLEIVPWLIKENFGGFFDGKNGLPGLIGKLNALQSTRAISTGGSGASSTPGKQP